MSLSATFQKLPLEVRIFLICFFVYAISAGGYLFGASGTPYFVYLAEALSQGGVALIPPLPRTYDLLLFEGNYYVAGAPLPAVLMLPAVLIFGTAFSDVLFGVIIGAINVVIVYRLLEERSLLIELPESGRLWLTLLFALGTPHWYTSVLGTVWFNAHTVTVMFLLLFVIMLLRGKTVWAGVLLSLAFLARPSAMYAGVFVIVYALLVETDWEARIRAWLTFGLGFAPGFGVALLYNWVRFGKWLEFGYDYVQGAENITDAFAQIGGFDPQFWGCNVMTSLVGLPDFFGRFAPLTARACAHLISTGIPESANNFLAPNPVGMSIFIATPALLLLFRANYRKALEQASLITALAILFTLWIYHNTGSLQFGYRYLLDATPFWLILLASAWTKLAERSAGKTNFPTGRHKLIIGSIVIQLWGLLWLYQLLHRLRWPALW